MRFLAMGEDRFLSIILDLSDTMYAVALAITQVPDDARDAVQESVSRLWASRRHLDHVSNVEGYCVRITQNVAIDIVRHRNGAVGLGPAAEQMHADTSPGPHVRMEIDEEYANMQKCMAMLPENYRQALMLRAECNYTFEQIAEVLEVTEDNARQLLSRARKKLKEIYLTYNI